MHTRRLTHGTIPVLSTLVLTACSGGGGGPPAGPGFLESESRVNTGTVGGSLATGPELYPSGSRVYVAFVDDRDGVEELFVNWSDDGGVTWGAQDVKVPGAAIGPLGVDPTGRKLAAGDGSLVAVFEESDDMFSNVSTDGGATWLAAATRLDPGGVNAADSDDPTVLYAGGNFYAVWQDEVAGAADVLFSRSVDGGFTWSAAAQVNSGAPGSAETRRARMVVTPLGVLYVVYEDDRNDLGGDRDIYFSRSSDGGSSWLASDVLVSANALADTSEARLCENGLNVYLGFLDKRTGVEKAYFTRSSNAGTTWSAVDTRLDASAPGIEVKDLQLAADGDLIAATWRVADPGPNSDIFVNVSTDGGLTWLPAPLRLDQDAAGAGESAGPNIAVEGQSIAVVWQDERTGLSDIYMRYSLDSGASWSAEMYVPGTLAGSAEGDEPSVALAGGQLWVTWQDDRNGGLDVFVNGGTPPGL